MLSSKAVAIRFRTVALGSRALSGLAILAFCLCASCTKPTGASGSAGVVDSGLSWAAGEVDTKLSEGPIKYYKASFPGAAGTRSASASSTTATVATTSTVATGNGAIGNGTTGNGATGESPDQALTIVDSGPRDELPSIVKRPQIYVVFSKPVVPLSALGAVMNSTPLMSVEPRAKGVFRWYGSRMLAFESSEDLLPQRLYTVKLAKDLKALDGTRLSGTDSFSFHSEYLAMKEIIPGDISNAQSDYGESYVDESALTDIPPDRARDFLIRFNYAVDPALVGKSLELSSDDAKLAFTASRPPAAKEGSSYRDGIDHYLRVQTKAAPPENADIRVNLRQGAKSERDALGSAEDQTLSFHSLLPFGFTEYSEYSWEFDEDEVPDKNPLFLVFSHPIKAESLAGAFDFAEGPAIPASAISSRDGTVRLNGLALARGSVYKLILSPGISDIYGRKLGSPVEVTVKTAPDRAYVEFPDSGPRMLEAGQPPRIAFAMKNMALGGVGLASVADPYRRGGSVPLASWDMSGAKPGVTSFGMLDLAPWLGSGGMGTVGIDWSFRPSGQKPRESKGSLTVQVTDIGLTMRYAYNRVICLVTKLSSGLPVRGAIVTLMGDRSPMKVGTADSRGLAIFSLAPGEYRSAFIQTRKPGTETDYEWEAGWRNGRRDSLRVRVESGQDRVEFVPNESHDVYSGPVQATEPIATIETPRPVAFLFSDRKIYRPGEEVGFRGIDRDLKLGRYSSYRGSWTAHLMPSDWDSKPIATIRGTCSELGGFYGKFVLPSAAEPGDYSILYERGDGSFDENGEHDEEFDNRPQAREWITVASFRKQLFAVSIGIPAKTLVSGDAVVADFSASYLSGGTLAGAAWNSYWTREPAWFDFGPAWSQYSFNPGSEGNRSTLDEKSGTLSAKGEGSVSATTSAKDAAGRPWTYTFNLNVTDATSGRVVGASRGFFVHPAAFALGLKLKGSAGPWLAVAEKGKPAAFEAVMVDPEGKEYSGSTGRKTAVEIVKVEWKVARQKGAASRINTRYERVETPFATMNVEIPRPAASPESARPAAFSFTPDSAGEYSVRISATDGSGRKALTELSLYVTGSGYTRWNPESAEAIDLKPDRQLYLPGDTAKILVRSPLPAGRYLLTIEREGILEERIVELSGSTSTLEIPVREDYLPIVYVTLSSYTVRSQPAGTKWGEPDLDKPKGLFGLAALAVDSPSRRIFLTVKPDRDHYLPGSKASVAISAVDSAGKPVQGAEVSFMAADRGVLDLVDYHVPDPRDTFYSTWNFPLATMGADSRSLLLDPVTYELKDLQGGAGDDGKEGAERSDFRSTAVFLPFLVTDSKGVAIANFPWPDSLTTWRCTAVAADTERFGLAESEIQVRNPVNAKSLMPELLRLRDTVSAGLMITNLEKTERKVTVACSSQLLSVAEEAKSKSVLVQPGQSARVDFRVSAAKTGAGKVLFAVSTDGFSETLVQAVQVEAPRTFESVSIIGSTRGRAEEGLVLPAQDFGSGSLDISLSSSLLPALGGAFDFLFTYPYGCMEQRLSALEPLVLFGERAGGYGIDSRVREPKTVIAEGLDYIARHQLPGGGFPYWPEGNSPNRYVSIRVAWLIHEAAERGYLMPESLDLRALLAWIASPAGTGVTKSSPPAEAEGRDYLSVCADYVLALHGYDIRSRLEPVLKAKTSGGVAPYALAGLALEASGDRAGAEKVFSSIRNLLVPSLRGVDLTDPHPEASSWYGGSGAGVESLSFILMLSHALEPDGEMTGKIARTLLARQSAGYWRSTAETVQALRALSRVIDDEERISLPGVATSTAPAAGATDPSAVSGTAGGSVSAGGKLLHETSFAEKKVSTVSLGLRMPPLDSLPRGMPLPLDFKSAVGSPIYYSSTLRYAIPEELALPRDEGIGLFTEVLAMDGSSADRQKLALGSLYRMRVVVSSARDRTFVAIRVPVPSGCEIIDSRFVTAARVAETPRAESEGEESRNIWRPSAIQSIYDNEVRYFLDQFDKGRTSMEFVFRAGTVGTYPVPPATAECMYEPEIFGRGAGGVTVIGEAARR